MYLTQALHRSAQQFADRPATVCGERTHTFARTAERVARLAGGLRALGVGEGDRVAYLGLNSDRFLEYYLATWWAGAVVNPVNVRWAAAEIGFSLEDSATTVLVVDDAFAPMIPELRRYGLRVVVHAGDGPMTGVDASWTELARSGDAVEDRRRGGDEPAGIWYTGGTTGFPKGVVLSHANLLVSAYGLSSCGVFGGDEPPRYLHVAPMFHLADLAGSIGAMLAGGTHVMVPSFAPVPVMDAVATHGVTHTVLIPIMIQALADHPERAGYDLSTLRRVVYGGSPIAQAVLERARTALPSAEFLQAYGQTELSPVATVLGCAEHDDPARRYLLRTGGRAAPHAEVRIVDESGEEVSRGSIGEIVCRGGHVMLGYWERPEETAAALRDGWMHTGDVGRMDPEGYVEVLDRLKDMIITGGENVYSTEVENAVATHPAVATCAVVGLPDETWGERVHAVVVLRDGVPSTDDTVAQIREHVRGLVAGYKTPRTVEFTDALPATPTGKVLKRELRARAVDPARSGSSEQPATA
ncbi:acyl-CoA synthetase [Pseudonocardia parietis]|uniref:Acyl-CoA synthetase (AMP-forming)/AMP-acid ligase II n=1 Tax=Pseudonocardia parietis TaxID=570936 RepID=A0ABS4VR14_9PSEU|nr:long-chain fatty acid--CoA ligase [Pseudonocardia parietis]MBP2366024.1 acyl-CoA synthetase (AMP-forming)/AMP-acid ligase II [Pseudonocardia parietis]